MRDNGCPGITWGALENYWYLRPLPRDPDLVGLGCGHNVNSAKHYPVFIGEEMAQSIEKWAEMPHHWAEGFPPHVSNCEARSLSIYCTMLCWLHRSTAVFLPVKRRVLPWPAFHESVGLYRVPVSLGPDVLVSAGCAQDAIGLDSCHFFGVQQAIWIPGSTALSIYVRETHFRWSL